MLKFSLYSSFLNRFIDDIFNICIQNGYIYLSLYIIGNYDIDYEIIRYNNTIFHYIFKNNLYLVFLELLSKYNHDSIKIHYLIKYKNSKNISAIDIALKRNYSEILNLYYSEINYRNFIEENESKLLIESGNIDILVKNKLMIHESSINLLVKKCIESKNVFNNTYALVFIHINKIDNLEEMLIDNFSFSIFLIYSKYLDIEKINYLIFKNLTKCKSINNDILNLVCYLDYHKLIYNKDIISMITRYENSCPICLDDINENRIYSICGHKYHKKCLNEYLQNYDKCAVCRYDITNMIYY